MSGSSPLFFFLILFLPPRGERQVSPISLFHFASAAARQDKARISCEARTHTRTRTQEAGRHEGFNVNKLNFDSFYFRTKIYFFFSPRRSSKVKGHDMVVWFYWWWF